MATQQQTSIFTESVPVFSSETKGSRFLRSDQMNYGRAILVSNWNQAREAEPKDYDINRSEVRDLSKSTYKRIGDNTDGSLPETTYQDHTQQIFLKKDYEERETRKPMITMETVGHANIDRDVGTPKHGFSSTLPRHHPDHDKYYLETTHNADFKPPYPYQPVSTSVEELPDHTLANKKCHSQFTDTSDYRRPGRNTWQDETGIYANTHFKRESHKPTHTIPSTM